MYTLGIGADEYAEFLSKLFRKVASGLEPDGCVWREDDDIHFGFEEPVAKKKRKKKKQPNPRIFKPTASSRAGSRKRFDQSDLPARATRQQTSKANAGHEAKVNDAREEGCSRYMAGVSLDDRLATMQAATDSKGRADSVPTPTVDGSESDDSRGESAAAAAAAPSLAAALGRRASVHVSQREAMDESMRSSQRRRSVAIDAKILQQAAEGVHDLVGFDATGGGDNRVVVPWLKLRGLRQLMMTKSRVAPALYSVECLET